MTVLHLRHGRVIHQPNSSPAPPAAVRAERSHTAIDSLSAIIQALPSALSSSRMLLGQQRRESNVWARRVRPRSGLLNS